MIGKLLSFLGTGNLSGAILVLGRVHKLKAGVLLQRSSNRFNIQFLIHSWWTKNGSTSQSMVVENTSLMFLFLGTFVVHVLRFLRVIESSM